MCETFQLEFDKEEGISAWADEAIFEAFSGDRMAQGDRWRIRLGRRIQLDPDDLDGSEFLEDLLEDVLFYPVKFGAMPRWETVKAQSGEWVTQPVFPDDISDHGSSDSDSSLSVHSSMIYSENEEYADSCSDEYSPERARGGAVVFEDRYDTSDDIGEAEEETINQAELSYHWAVTHGPWGYDQNSDTQEEGTPRSGDELEDKDEDEEEDEEMRAVSDSDEPGSGWDSEEVLSGDEDVQARRVWIPDLPAGPIRGLSHFSGPWPAGRSFVQDKENRWNSVTMKPF